MGLTTKYSGAGAYVANDPSPWNAGTTWSHHRHCPIQRLVAMTLVHLTMIATQSLRWLMLLHNYHTSLTNEQLSVNVPMTPITVSATTSYVTNTSSQPFYHAINDVHQDADIAIDSNGNSHICYRTR